MKFLGLHKLRVSLLGLAVGLLVVCFFSYRASAAPNPANLTTSPVLINMSVAPGTTQTQTVELMDNSSSPVQINMELMTFGANGTSGEAEITDIPGSNPESSYIKFSPSSFTAQPKVWSKVKVTISMPKSATLGYYYAIVFHPVYLSANVTGKNIIQGSNAILVLLNTNAGNEQKSIQVASFSVSKRIYVYLPATFSVNIHNSGNIYLAPHGDVYISRSNDSSPSIAALAVNSGGGNVLPNSNRIFTTSWSDSFPVYKPVLKNGNPVFNSHNQPESKLTWNFGQVSKFRFGRYYATLIMTYNNGNKTVLLTASLDSLGNTLAHTDTSFSPNFNYCL